MNDYLEILIIVCPLVFLAGFVDAVAGGGGIISIPAYLIAGLPPHFASGTNKLAMCFGTSLSSFKYIKSGKVNTIIACSAAIGSLLGAYIGSSVALYLSSDMLEKLLLFALPIAGLFLVFKRGFCDGDGKYKQQSKKKLMLLSFIIGIFIGAYDGLIGPGTGTFLIMAFTAVLGTDLLISSGCAKVANLASNFASVIVYLLGGKIIFPIALTAAIFTMSGNYLGAHIAIKGGTKYIKLVMIFVLILLFIKTALKL